MSIPGLWYRFENECRSSHAQTLATRQAERGARDHRSIAATPQTIQNHRDTHLERYKLLPFRSSRVHGPTSVMTFVSLLHVVTQTRLREFCHDCLEAYTWRDPGTISLSFSFFFVLWTMVWFIMVVFFSAFFTVPVVPVVRINQLTRAVTVSKGVRCAAFECYQCQPMPNAVHHTSRKVSGLINTLISRRLSEKAHTTLLSPAGQAYARIQ